MACPNLKTYAEVRREKLEKINKYHTQDLLNNYIQYTGFSANDETMKAKYKQQLETLNKEMLNILSNDVELLLEQHNELESKTHEVNNNKELIKQIKNEIETETVSSDARLQNTTEMEKLEKRHRTYHNLHFYGNILLFIIIITLLFLTVLK